MTELRIIETFSSIQGESSYAGKLCYFIRLAGCNLRCGYCDTEYSYDGGTDISISDMVQDSISQKGGLIEITGGEPLLQNGFEELALTLQRESGKTVLVETNGTCDISVIPEGVIAIVDVKCPGSGEGGTFDMDNISRLRPSDEVKFVLSGKKDYEWARDFVIEHDLICKCAVVHFSPVEGLVNGDELAGWIMEDGIDVRLSVQLHKCLGLR